MLPLEVVGDAGPFVIGPDCLLEIKHVGSHFFRAERNDFEVKTILILKENNYTNTAEALSEGGTPLLVKTFRANPPIGSRSFIS